MSMQSSMASDLAALFARDMTTECTIGGAKYNVLVDDGLTEETEAYGGPEAVEFQRVHFLAVDKPKIEVGSKMNVLGKSKIVLSVVKSADGNELIATVRGD